eukprot:Skav210515  [mRNA]  locus=scaffold3045:49653:52968:+ [translate_table: standard]
MNNGCICCTVRGDLIAGLKKLHKQTTGKGKPLDGIIIETTGLADPAPVAQTFFADDAHFQQVFEHFEYLGVIPRTDLVDESTLQKVESEIRRINKTAAIRRTQNSRVDMDFILGIQAGTARMEKL